MKALVVGALMVVPDVPVHVPVVVVHVLEVARDVTDVVLRAPVATGLALHHVVHKPNRHKRTDLQ